MVCVWARERCCVAFCRFRPLKIRRRRRPVSDDADEIATTAFEIETRENRNETATKIRRVGEDVPNGFLAKIDKNKQRNRFPRQRNRFSRQQDRFSQKRNPR